MLTSKTKCFRLMVYTFDLSDKRSKRLVAMTAEFMKNFGAGPQDPFAIYVRRSEKVKGPKALSKRTVTAQDFNREIRISADDTLGLPADRFSTKSYREALATKNQLAGVPEEETCRLGRWKGSHTIKEVYDHSRAVVVSARRRKSNRPLVPTSNEARLSLDQVASLLPVEDQRALRVKAFEKAKHGHNK